MEVEPAQRALNQSQGGNKALMVAAALAREQAIPTLLAHQPDLGVRNADGNTALMLAAMSGNREIVLQLLEAGADPLSRNARKMNARELAEAAGHSDVAEFIEDYAANNRSWMRVITG
jgi:ankyrin repeat protein